MKIKVSLFHRACRAVIVSEKTDDYTKAMAQVGLGLWDAIAIQVQCFRLLPNVQHLKGNEAALVRSTLRRYSHN